MSLQRHNSDLKALAGGIGVALPMLIPDLPAGAAQPYALHPPPDHDPTPLFSTGCAPCYWRGCALSSRLALFGLGMYLLLAWAPPARPEPAGAGGGCAQLVPAPIFPMPPRVCSFFETASVIVLQSAGFSVKKHPLAYVVSAVFCAACTVLFWKLPENNNRTRRSEKPGLSDCRFGPVVLSAHQLMLAR